MGEYEPNDSRKVTGANAPGQQQQAGQQGGQQGMGDASISQSQQQGHGQDPGWRSQAPSEAGARQGQMGQSQMGGGQSGGMSSGQQGQFQSDKSGQMGGGSGTSYGGQIREHMEVIGADGVHLGTVDSIEGDRIKLTKADSGMGSHQGHHHFLPMGLVAGVEGNKVRLSANADVALGMEDEGGQ